MRILSRIRRVNSSYDFNELLNRSSAVLIYRYWRKIRFYRLEHQ